MSTACLVAIMAMGPGYHRESERELLEAARANHCLAPVMTSAGALIEGLKTLGGRRISLRGIVTVTGCAGRVRR
jgi:maleate isomerase